MINEKNYVVNKLIALAENMYEGLEHIYALVREGKRGQTIDLLVDVLEGFASVEEAIILVWGNDRDRMIELTNSLRNDFSSLVKSYENNNEITVLNELEMNVLPSCKNWLEYIKVYSKLEC